MRFVNHKVLPCNLLQRGVLNVGNLARMQQVCEATHNLHWQHTAAYLVRGDKDVIFTRFF